MKVFYLDEPRETRYYPHNLSVEALQRETWASREGERNDDTRFGHEEVTNSLKKILRKLMDHALPLSSSSFAYSSFSFLFLSHRNSKHKNKGNATSVTDCYRNAGARAITVTYRVSSRGIVNGRNSRPEVVNSDVRESRPKGKLPFARKRCAQRADQSRPPTQRAAPFLRNLRQNLKRVEKEHAPGNETQPT